MAGCYEQISVSANWSLVVNRYLNFFTLFRAKRRQLFTQYEQQDGEYHGTTTLVINNPDMDVSQLSEDSGFDSVDNDFA